MCDGCFDMESAAFEVRYKEDAGLWLCESCYESWKKENDES